MTKKYDTNNQNFNKNNTTKIQKPKFYFYISV